MSSDTVIIIPAYNEERAIAGVVAAVKKMYPVIDIAVVDDGSSDGTAHMAGNAGAIVLSHPFNMGYGVALQTGYKYAIRNGYTFLVQMDGDGQHDPACIQTVLQPVKDGTLDVVLGSRFLDGNSYSPSLVRMIGIRFFRLLVRLLSGKSVTDPTTGFQATNKKVLSVFIQDIFPVDYPDADVVVMLSGMDFKIGEVPVVMHPNRQGKSMHGRPLKVMYYIFKMVLSMFLTKMRKYPVSTVSEREEQQCR